MHIFNESARVLNCTVLIRDLLPYLLARMHAESCAGGLGTEWLWTLVKQQSYTKIPWNDSLDTTGAEIKNKA